MTTIDKSLEDPNTLPPQTEIGGFDEFVDGKTRFKFKRLSERTPGEAWMLLVYGPSKTGKTYTAGTAGPRSLHINTGEGIDTLLSPAFRDRYPQAKDTILVDVREADGVVNAFDMITDAIDHALKHFPEKFDWVVLDDATFMRKYALNKAMDLNTAARTQGKKRESRGTDYVKAEIGDYGTEMDMINWFLSQYVSIFKGMGKHFVMLAHERQIYGKPERQGDEPVLKRVVPGFTGKTFPDNVPAFFDDVMHMEVISDASGHSEYRLRTAGNDTEMGGTRHGGIFPSIVKDPNLNTMLEMIRKAQRFQPTSIRR